MVVTEQERTGKEDREWREEEGLEVKMNREEGAQWNHLF